MSGSVTPVEGVEAFPPLLDPPLLRPVQLVPSLLFEPCGDGQRAGRPVLRVRAWPREPSGLSEELSYELEFDAEHGTMMRYAVSKGGQHVRITEALEIVYGLAIDSELFTFNAPETPARRVGVPVASPTAQRRRSHDDRGDCGSTRGHAQTLWLTDLPGAGKTTLALALQHELAQLGHPACVLDGDELRSGLSSDLGFSRHDRAEQARRAAHAALLVAKSNVIAIVALVSPYAEDRGRARKIHELGCVPFVEVWVDTPLPVCEERDPKGLFASVRAGDVVGITGFDAPYEPPQAPELRVSGNHGPPEVAARRIARLLMRPTPRGTAV